jgi:hypothetical protein
MREVLLILVVIVGLLVLTAVRYRKQIAGVLGVARMLREAKRSASETSRSVQGDNVRDNRLVNCAKCGVWVPEVKALRSGKLFFCSDECFVAVKA